VVVVEVDRREAPSRIHDFLKARGASIRLTTQSAGDYTLGRGFGIERKRCDDFARSVVDGRLFEQAGKLRRHFARPVLIVEGLVAGRSVLHVGWPQLRGAIVSVSAMFGIPVLHSSGPLETAEIILAAARQAARSFSMGYVRPGWRPTGWRKRALFILQGLPTIGPSRATALLDAFGSVQGVISADEAGLKQVSGIGARVARGIRQAVSPEGQFTAAVSDTLNSQPGRPPPAERRDDVH